MAEDEKYWLRVCKVEGCHTNAYPTSDYCKKHREEHREELKDECEADRCVACSKVNCGARA